MHIVEKYTGERTYMFPSGKLATPEVMLQEFPAILTFAHIIETDENHEVCMSVQNLSSARTFYNIDRTLSEEDAIAKIQEIVNTVPETASVEYEPTTDERIAAALEYQVMASLPDDTTESV